MEEARFEKVRRKALKYLSYRIRSQGELSLFLQRQGLPEILIAGVLAEFSRLGYLDDRRYAAEYARSRLARGYGPQRIRCELRGKGVANQLVEEATAFITPDEETELASLLLEKRTARGYDQESCREMSSHAAFLKRRGFSEEIIIKVIKRGQIFT